MGSTYMLGLAKRVKAKILQASTSEVYGDPLIHPQNEDYWGNVNTIGLRSCYDAGKRCAETLFLDYHRHNNVKIKIMDTSDDIIGPFNIGNPEEITIKKLADLIIDLTKSSSKIKFLDLPKYDPVRRNPDIAEIKDMINWYPKVNLEEGLLKTIDYFERKLSLKKVICPPGGQ